VIIYNSRDIFVNIIMTRPANVGSEVLIRAGGWMGVCRNKNTWARVSFCPKTVPKKHQNVLGRECLFAPKWCQKHQNVQICMLNFKNFTGHPHNAEGVLSLDLFPLALRHFVSLRYTRAIICLSPNKFRVTLQGCSSRILIGPADFPPPMGEVWFFSLGG